MTSRRWLFSSGMEYIAWIKKECCSCEHFIPGSRPGSGCPTEEIVSVANILGDAIPVPEELEEHPGSPHPYICKKRVERKDAL